MPDLKIRREHALGLAPARQIARDWVATAIDKFGADVTDEGDQTLVILYAGWLWRSQKDPGLQKPPALQMAINDRAVRKATEGGDV